MRKLCGIVVLSLLCGSVFASTIGNWVGPTGSFDDDSKWKSSLGPSTWTSTSTGDEVKICIEGGVCTLDSSLTVPALYRYSVASGPTSGSTLDIVDGAQFDFGETRIGAQGATTYSIGYVNQTGGSVTYRDLLLGRGSNKEDSNPDIRAYYTISGGSIGYTSTYGRLYVGCGNNILADSGYITNGYFTVVGHSASILFNALWVGGNTSTYGHGTIAFQIDPNGVSPINLNSTYNLDVYTVNSALSEAHLVVSATGDTTPSEDIVLVQVNSSVTPTTRFDTFNGGSAAEGTEIILGDNIYYLTYEYAANDSSENDIALVHVHNFSELAHDPVPADDATVTTLSSLSWTNPDPNSPGGVITCDVYLGTTASRSSMNKKTLIAGVSTVAINKTNFPTYGSLSDKTTYYWVVDVHDTTEPNVLSGMMWSFYTDINVAPVVDAGADQAVWLGKSGTAGQEVVALDATVTDDGFPTSSTLSYTWSLVSGPTTVVISPTNTVDTSMTVTEVGTYELMLSVSDGEKTSSNTILVYVGTDACNASHLSTGDSYDVGDYNQDCIVNLVDFAALLAPNWLDCTDTRTDCGM